MKKFWLVKSEAATYGWADLVRDGKTSWTGVRNFTARNNLRAMQVGDHALFYHSVSEKAVVGIAEVKRTAYPDKTAEEGDWSTVDLVPNRALPKPVTLTDVKGNARLAAMSLLRYSRLSVQPVTAAEFAEIVRMGGATAR